MQKYLMRLVDERNSLAGLAQTLSDKVAADDRDMTEPECQRMRDWQERSAELDRQIGEHNEFLSTQRSWAKLQDSLRTNSEETERPAGALATRAGAGLETRGGWGEAFTSSDAFQSYNGHGSSAEVILNIERRAPIDTSWMTVPSAIYTPTPWQMTTPFLDSISHETVSSNTVEWVEYPASWPIAQIVAEGALKPEANFAPTPQTASLNTIAHHKPITRQALEDIPRVQSIVETALRQGITAKLEADAAAAVNGGTYGTTTGTEMLPAIRQALGEVQARGYAQANAVLLNPADWASLDIAVMVESVDGPVRVPSYWGLRPIAAPTVAVGTAFVGDFKAGVVQFERNTASVYMTDSHDDYFLRNILVILAETRALSVVAQPAAIQEVTVTAGA